jgi:PBP1b-binding outer membrane lipoprotein LpoB
MKIAIITLAIVLAGCSTMDPDVEKSTSRDKTMERLAKIALINEMLSSPDPSVRLEGSRIAKEFINGSEKKKGLFD